MDVLRLLCIVLLVWMLRELDVICQFHSFFFFFVVCLILVIIDNFFRKRPGIIPKLEALRTLYEGKKIIVGRDKLEVVKGVLQKVSSPSFSLLQSKLINSSRIVTSIRKITSGLS